MSTKQLYEKTSEGMKEVSPLVSIEDIYSKLSDTPLEALVSLFNDAYRIERDLLEIIKNDITAVSIVGLNIKPKI